MAIAALKELKNAFWELSLLCRHCWTSLSFHCSFEDGSGQHGAAGGSTPHWPSLKVLLNLLCNLASSPVNQEVLRARFAVSAIFDTTVTIIDKFLVSITTKTTISFFFVSFSYTLSLPSLQTPGQAGYSMEGVSVEDVLEICINCLLHFAKDARNRDEVLMPKPTFMKMFEVIHWYLL